MTLYAFSRLVDDAVDNATSEVTARQEIQVWRKRLDACFEENAVEDPAILHPILPEMKSTIQKFHIPKATLSDLLTGMEMDLAKNRYKNFQELERYCYHVAGTVGLLCNHLFGLDDERGRAYALLLGTAFQLTNILRDIGSDAQRGRIYIPLEELARFGLTEESILKAEKSPSMDHLLIFQADRAEGYFKKAYETLPQKIRNQMIPAAMMDAIYHQILKKIRRENFPVFERKVSLSKFKKMGLVMKTLIESLL